MAATPNIIGLITDWIDANTSLVKGTNLFARELTNDSIKRSVLLRVIPAGQDIQQRDFEDFQMQAIARANTYDVAESDALIVFDFLHRNKKSLHELPNDVSPQFEILQCWALQQPYAMERDKKRRAMYVNNYFFKILKP
jgi:hypothetical protein